jgi:hypothetical protein
MKFSGWMFAFLTGFYLVVAAIYNYMSKDPVGTTAIALLGGLSFLVAFYVLFTDKRVGDLPEDNPLANISDADSDYGFFSPHSWWPLVIGVGTSIFIMGFIFAVWLAIIGVGFLLFGIWGLIFEYYRGDFAH